MDLGGEDEEMEGAWADARDLSHRDPSAGMEGDFWEMVIISLEHSVFKELWLIGSLYLCLELRSEAPTE